MRTLFLSLDGYPLLTGFMIKLHAVDGPDNNREWCHTMNISHPININAVEPGKVNVVIDSLDEFY